MLRFLRLTAPAIVWLLCVIVLTVRLSGVHAHRDLAVAQQFLVHGHDQHAHHHALHDREVGPGHAHADGQVDVEVDALGGGVKLSGSAGAIVTALMFVAALTLLIPPRAVPIPRDPTRLRSLLAFHWRPPLRGPPRFSIA